MFDFRSKFSEIDLSSYQLGWPQEAAANELQATVQAALITLLFCILCINFISVHPKN